ncbi:hypothetical protein QWZ16_19855 [Vibrio ostreicida]|uniref:Uncharacterized protein n=1 Tax=Vibrio ostreicida TaxID=526588 RepID=A0ABT8BXV2_9VIBR|nr:hypothetical protein [Vibrio ostreicida]MDN3611853.1 hypothetical protein [Vibrio ostreicida]
MIFSLMCRNGTLWQRMDQIHLEFKFSVGQRLDCIRRQRPTKLHVFIAVAIYGNQGFRRLDK